MSKIETTKVYHVEYRVVTKDDRDEWKRLQSWTDEPHIRQAYNEERQKKHRFKENYYEYRLISVTVITEILEKDIQSNS